MVGYDCDLTRCSFSLGRKRRRRRDGGNLSFSLFDMLLMLSSPKAHFEH
jgi:hypothetical protein